MSKEQAQKAILEYGEIEFRPNDIHFIFEPTEIYNEGRVCIVKIDRVELSVNDEILIEKNGKFEKEIIIDIQENDKSVKQVSTRKIGLKLNIKLERKSTLWKKGSH